jgi:hypothetical protein
MVGWVNPRDGVAEERDGLHGDLHFWAAWADEDVVDALVEQLGGFSAAPAGDPTAASRPPERRRRRAQHANPQQHT